MAKLRPYHQKNLLEAGCDEAGRGCLAGPVFAAAVILPSGFRCPDLNDSKQLSESKREKIRTVIEKGAVAWSVARIEAHVIDRINILRASIQAMHNAVRDLRVQPDFLLIDGNRFYPYRDIPHECFVSGDAKYRAIAAASILAKTYRDEWMRDLHDQFPHYGWNQNKGYPTHSHREAIHVHGYTPEHRRTFQVTFAIEKQLELFT